MIIELFGLPASGKTTLARLWESERIHLVQAPGQAALVILNLWFMLRYPFRSVCLLSALFQYAPPEARHLLFMNTFLVHNAKYILARHAARDGRIVIIDQGHFQNPLSVFEVPPPEHVLKAYLEILPKPDLLVVLDVSKAERDLRLANRDSLPRSEFGPEAAERAADTAEQDFPRVMSLLSLIGVRYRKISGNAPPLMSILTEHLTYATAARIPTEKAHGVSITAMASMFAKAGKNVLLLIPTRKNQITEDVFSYYGTSDDFRIERMPVPDFVGSGLTSAPFFLLQRMLFMMKLLSALPPPGIIYTREPEIAWAFSKTHPTIFEAHRMPRGFPGWLTAVLVRRCHLIVCNSRGTEDAFRERDITRTVVAPNGFDPLRFEGPIRSREELGLPLGFLALYAGSEEPWKGVSVFRNAARHAPGVSFVVLGSTAKGERNGVFEMGRVRRTDIGEYLRSADVLVLPNTRKNEESERFTSPIKLFEYLAAGKPIVASDLPSIREILTGEEALFVPSGDPEALAAGLVRLKDDAALCARLATHAQALSLSYTWETRAKRILAALTP